MRIISTSIETQAEQKEENLRPLSFDRYIGQEKIKENLKISIKAAKLRNEPLDHVLLYGPPGLGKTTLAQIIANEMGGKIKITSGPAIQKTGELAAILARLDENDVLFIDEIHRLDKTVEEALYPAMEDFCFDTTVGKEQGAKSVRIPLKKFTLIGATTRAGMLSAPLRDRFGIVGRLEYYKDEELSSIIKQTANHFSLNITDKAALTLAECSRGTPRIANRIVKRVRDFAELKEQDVDELLAIKVLKALEISERGLTAQDIKFLETLLYQFGAGPVGLTTLAASIGEDIATIESVIEPYLIYIGALQKKPRGRVLTEYGQSLLRKKAS